MAEYNKTIVTLKGLQLISKVHQGVGDIKFTKFKTGDGVYSYDKDEIEKMEDLLNMKQNFNITKIVRESDITIMLTLAISNLDLQTGYYVNEIGIFAMDPDEGEILYAVTTSKESNIDYLPQYNGVSTSKIMIDQYITMSNSDQVSIIINPESPNIEFEDWNMQDPPNFEDSITKLESGETLSNLVSNIKSSIMGLSSKLDEIELLDTAITVKDQNQHFKGDKLNEVLDELFTFADSGRKAIVTAIGVPASPSDTFKTLAQRIDSAQSDIRTAANEKGANIPLNPTFPQIIDGINATGHFLRSDQISGLNAQIGFTEVGKIILSWQNPTTDPNFSGVRIMYNVGAYPTSADDGLLLYDSMGSLPAGTAKTFIGSEGVEYYFRGFSYAIFGSERQYTETLTGAQISAIPYREKGMVVLTESTIWRVPDKVTDLEVFLVGGGGAGCFGWTNNNETGYYEGRPGGGGGAGYTMTAKTNVAVGDKIAAIIGAGGASTLTTYANGSSTTFGSLEAKGGEAGKTLAGGKGGSGGGDGAGNNGGNAGDGGWDGSNGTTGYISTSKPPSTYGIGQGSTTRAFGEVGNTLYAGGGSGGGGPWRGQSLTGGGIAGQGGGGSGNSSSGTGGGQVPGYPGTPNTGGGGGGAGANTSPSYRFKGGDGGSGIIIIRWGYN